MPIKTFKMTVGEKISGEIVEVYAAASPKDRDEGRGPLMDRSYHLTERDALIATKGISVMGSDGVVEKRLAIRLNDVYFFAPKDCFTIDTDSVRAAEVREEALKKLSPAKRAALLG